MKLLKNSRLLIAGLAIIISLTSCEKEPVANFTTTATSFNVGDEVAFINSSTEAFDYLWNFGDGEVSTLENPIHIFQEAGIYNVALTAYSESGKYTNTANSNITILQPNEMVSGDNHYPLANGALEYYGDWEGSGSYNFDITLFSSGINYPNEFGSGSIITLELWTSSDTQLETGTYYFGTQSIAGTITYGVLSYDFNMETYEGVIYEVVSAVAQVSMDGSNYDLEFDLVLDNGTSTKVYYKGPLTYYDYSDKGSSKSIFLKK